MLYEVITVALNEVIDVFGVRVVVGTVDECYRVLGLAHGLYRPMPGRFKDYIAIPRVNGYQSLHTTLFGPNGRFRCQPPRRGEP